MKNCQYCGKEIGYDGKRYSTEEQRDGQDVLYCHDICQINNAEYERLSPALISFLANCRTQITLDDLAHIGRLDSRALMTIVYCPVCGLDKCTDLCNLPSNKKLHFAIQELRFLGGW